MPSDQATWLISAPQDGDSEGLLQELESSFKKEIRSFDRSSLTQIPIPAFKVGLRIDFTCSSLITDFLISS